MESDGIAFEAINNNTLRTKLSVKLMLYLSYNTIVRQSKFIELLYIGVKGDYCLVRTFTLYL